LLAGATSVVLGSAVAVAMTATIVREQDHSTVSRLSSQVDADYVDAYRTHVLKHRCRPQGVAVC
jgi:hypothetical protein